MGVNELEDWTAPEPGAATGAPAALPDWTEETSAPHKSVVRRSSQATASAAPAVPEGPAPDWPTALSQGYHNLLPSSINAVKDAASAVVHPGQTWDTLKQLGSGAVSQLQGAFGAQQEPKQKAQTEAVLDALEGHYKQVYGPVFKGDTGNLRKAIATDPASILMDASAATTGGGSLAAKALGETGAVGKAAAIAAKAAQYADPVNLAVKTAGGLGKGAAWIGRSGQGIFSGIPESVSKIAAQAGAETQPELRDVFKRYMHGQVNNSAEFQQAAQGALGQVRQEASQDYLAEKAGLMNARPSYQPITDAIQEARQKIQRGGYNAGQFPQANAALDDAQKMIANWFASPDPSYHSMEGFDNLKQAVWDKVDETSNEAGKTALKGVYNGVKQAIIDVDPGYAKLMEQYQLGRNNINDLTKTLGLGNNAAATSALAKAFRQMKTAQGQNLLGQLSAKDPRLPYMIAGTALNPWFRGGHGNMIEGIFGAGLAIHNPATLPFSIAAQSPRVSGEFNYAAGAAGRRLAPVVSPAGRYTAYQLGKAGDPEQSDKQQAVFDRMLNQESGNKQFGADGSVVTSPKGAVGAAQIMPHTGPEAAEAAGLPWEPEKLSTDEGYNRKLGAAYHGKLSKLFGDPIIGAAAYNAGPTRVASAIKAAKEKGGSYLDYLPSETRQYVASLDTGRVQRASGGKVDDIGPLVTRLIGMVKQAKRATDKGTSALLNVPDESIVKALDVAQQAI